MKYEETIYIDDEQLCKYLSPLRFSKEELSEVFNNMKRFDWSYPCRSKYTPLLVTIDNKKEIKMTEEQKQKIAKDLQETLDNIYDLWESIDNDVDKYRIDIRITNVIKKIIKIKKNINSQNNGTVCSAPNDPKLSQECVDNFNKYHAPWKLQS